MSLLRAQGIRAGAAVNAAGEADGGQAQGTPLWLVTFADLIAILVLFFVLLFSLSSVKPETWAALRAKPDRAVVAENTADQSGQWVVEPRRKGVGVELVQPRAQNLLYLATVIEQQIGQLAGQRTEGELSPWLPVPDVGADHLSLFLPDEHMLSRLRGAPVLSPEGRRITATLAPVLAYSGNHVDVVATMAAGTVADWRAILVRAEVLRQGLRDAGYAAPTGLYGRYGTQIPGVEIFIHSYGSSDLND